MVAIGLAVSRDEKPLEMVTQMLEHRGAKPSYKMASEIGLVLHNCGFETASFEVSETDRGAVVRGLMVNCIQEHLSDLTIRRSLVESMVIGVG